MDTREVTMEYRLSQWTEIIRECRSSGQKVAEWCDDHDIKPSSYYYWLRRVRKAACDSLPQNNNSENRQIVPLLPTDNTVWDSDSEQKRMSYDIRVHIGDFLIDISNTASSTLIENTLKVVSHAR